jgi:transposase-like protein
MREILKGLKIKDMNDVSSLFKEMIGMVLEDGLEGELDEKLGYSKYEL